MNPSRPSLFGAAVGVALLAVASSASAVTLNNSFSGQNFLDTALPGTTVVARPELAGTVVADELQAFSFDALNISGTVQSRVVRETGTGTLDFYWKINVDPRSTGGGVSALRLVNFGYGYLTDADWRSDGLGSAAPGTARLFNPVAYPGGALNFLFGDTPVQPGDPANDQSGSRFFFLHTTATSFAKTAAYDLLSSPSFALSPVYATFAPAVPEPATWALMGLGLAGLAAVSRRRLH